MPDSEPDHLVPPNITPYAREGLQTFRAACATGNLKEVTHLAASDHPPSRGYYLKEGLKAAMTQKQLEVVRYLLDQGTEIDVSIALAAVISKSLAVFKILAEHGWDINTPFGGGYTALGNVIENEELARWLLARGANPNLGPQPYNRQPLSRSITNSGAILEIAAALSNPTFFDILLQHGAKLENSSPLHQAAGRRAARENDRIPMLEHLLRLGVDINGSDDNRGRLAVGTPLHCAINTGAIVNAKFLLENGADIQAKSRRGLSAAELAKETRREEMIDLIESFDR